MTGPSLFNELYVFLSTTCVAHDVFECKTATHGQCDSARNSDDERRNQKGKPWAFSTNVATCGATCASSKQFDALPLYAQHG